MKSKEKIFKNIMLCFSFCLLVFTLVSCGARKVNKSQTKEQTEKKEKIVVENDITATDNITITSKSFVIDSTKEIITTKNYKPMNPNLPATFTDSKGNKQELHNTEYTESEIKRNKALSEETNTNTKHDSKTQDKSKKKGEKKEQNKKDEETKQSEREQFDIIGMVLQYWWLWLIILLVLWLYKKYKDKVTFI